MVVVYAGLVLRRLGELGEAGAPLGAGRRRPGVCRLRRRAARTSTFRRRPVAKRIKAMRGAFFGRNAVYHAALARGNPRALAEALARNVYRGQVAARACGAARLLAERIFAASRALEAAESGDVSPPDGSTIREGQGVVN